jgi:hypothetical protein
MAKVERSTGRTQRPLFRWVAAGSAAAFLVSSAYQASWAQTARDYDRDDGLDSKDLALIATGAALGIAGLWWLLAGSRDDDDDEEAQEVKAPAPKDGAAVSELRLVPSRQRVGAGEQAVFDLQARTNGEWRSVTNRGEASIAVAEGAGLVRLDGAKNAFALPITAVPGTQEVVVEGRFDRPGAGPLTARTTITVGDTE